MSTDMLSAFSGLKGVLAQAQADTGKGGNFEMLGWCPKKGVSNNILREIKVDPDSSIKIDREGTEVPGTTIQFMWTTYENPDCATPKEWKGTPFQMPRDPKYFLNQKGDKNPKTGEVKKSRFFYDIGRLKGLIKAVIGREVSDETFGADLQEAINAVSSSTVVLEINMKIEESDEYGVNRKEFGVKSLSGVAG